MSRLEDYRDAYDIARIRREDGILEIALQSPGGGPLVWNGHAHASLGLLWGDIGADPDNEIIILTGNGDAFIPDIDLSAMGVPTPEVWDVVMRNGTRMRRNHLAIDIPMIAAVNGPARAHSEQALMCDLVIASDNADFQDGAHFIRGIVPGDFVQAVYTHLLGSNRARYFLFTGQIIAAQEALSLGLVSEVTAPEALMPRAWELARELKKQPRLVRRHTRAAGVAALRKVYADHHDMGTMLEALGVWGRFYGEPA